MKDYMYDKDQEYYRRITDWSDIDFKKHEGAANTIFTAIEKINQEWKKLDNEMKNNFDNDIDKSLALSIMYLMMREHKLKYKGKRVKEGDMLHHLLLGDLFELIKANKKKWSSLKEEIKKDFSNKMNIWLSICLAPYFTQEGLSIKY